MLQQKEMSFQPITIQEIRDVLHAYFHDAYHSMVVAEKAVDVWLLCKGNIPVNLSEPHECFIEQSGTAGRGRNGFVDYPAYVRINSKSGQIYNRKFADTGDVLAFLQTYYPPEAWLAYSEIATRQTQRRKEEASQKQAAEDVASDVLIPSLKQIVEVTERSMPQDMPQDIAHDAIRNILSKYAATIGAVPRVTSQQDAVNTLARIAALV
jgi:hypothetical protein